MKQLNYWRKARPFLTDVLLPHWKKSFADDAAVLEGVIEAADKAVKFVLPDGGRIFNDKLKGLEGLEHLRLPYENVLIEYQAENNSFGVAEQVCGVENTRPYPRRIVLASEQGEHIFIYSVVGADVDGVTGWPMQPMAVVVKKHDSTEGLEVSIKSVNETTVRGIGAFIAPLGSLYEKVYGQGKEEWAWADMSDEVLAVLELVEALSCSNVTHEPMPQPKMNKSAIRRGAAPFDEYRMLVLKGADKSYPAKGGSHASPREHLRRGHIRALQNGNRIWINSCVVNAGIGGRIAKSYDMRKVA